MALNVTNIPRIFLHGKRELDDPDPGMTPEQVLSFYSNTFTELTTASLNGPKIKDSKAFYKFTTTVGTKG